MSATDGPTLQAGALTQADRQIDNLSSKITTYNVESDPAYLSMANQIKGKYERLKEETKNLTSNNYNVILKRNKIDKHN
jgi:hypothetical protein